MYFCLYCIQSMKSRYTGFWKIQVYNTTHPRSCSLLPSFWSFYTLKSPIVANLAFFRIGWVSALPSILLLGRDLTNISVSLGKFQIIFDIPPEISGLKSVDYKMGERAKQNELNRSSLRHWARALNSALS
jgi:hypothetical protein